MIVNCIKVYYNEKITYEKMFVQQNIDKADVTIFIIFKFMKIVQAWTNCGTPSMHGILFSIDISTQILMSAIFFLCDYF